MEKRCGASRNDPAVTYELAGFNNEQHERERERERVWC